MFSLFGPKKEKIRITDKIWMNTAVKLNQLVLAHQQNPSLLILCWFSETYDQLTALLPENTDAIRLIAHLHGTDLRNRQPVFAEHYPLEENELAFAEKYNLTTLEVWTALDEPLLLHFGGDRISGLMKTLGMTENESIQHALISSSIRNAQHSLAKKITMELQSTSQREWLRKNLGG